MEKCIDCGGTEDLLYMDDGRRICRACANDLIDDAYEEEDDNTRS